MKYKKAIFGPAALCVVCWLCENIFVHAVDQQLIELICGTPVGHKTFSWGCQKC
jgi:hypothetical protein